MDLSVIIDLLSVIAVVSGLIFAGVELRQYRLSKKRESALELFKAWQSLPFMSGFRAVNDLPDNLSVKELEELAGERMDDIFYLSVTLEGMGVLVYQRELDIEQLEDFYDGIILMTWRKLKRYIEERRKIHGRDTYGEYIQWLAERIMEREKAEPAVPAYIKHKDWVYKK